MEELFPGLRVMGYTQTSEPTIRYNCIAWAARDETRWWWPDPWGEGYWPADVERVETLEAFVEAYRTLGYEPCGTAAREDGFEKVAIFTDREGLPQHAARQLENGRWTSKLGELEDIEHALDGLEGARYGKVAQVLRRALGESPR
jgi:hypothetical protein